LNLVLALMVALLFVGLLRFPVSVCAAGDGRVVSHSGYRDSDGNYHVVGEVENFGDVAVNYVRVTATFYDSSNFVIDSRFDLTMIYVILSGRKAPFDVALLDVAESALVDHYELSVTFLEASPLPMGLEIVSQSSSVDAMDQMHVTGELRNGGSLNLTNGKVVATFYGQASKVVAAAYTFLDPELIGEITPNQTVPFEIALSAERTGHVSTFALTAESSQYAAIPEYAPLTLVALFSIGSGIAFFALRRRRP